MTCRTLAVSAAILAMLMLSACNREDFGATASVKRDSAVEQQLFSLARMNGCLDCHTVTVDKFGPSWNEIALRYKDAPREDVRALLIDSVENGSQGKYLSWKTAEGMPPLKRRVSSEHIAQLVDYILALQD